MNNAVFLLQMGHFLKVSLSHLVSMPPTDGTNPILALIQDCTVNQDSMHAHRFAMSAIASAHNTHVSSFRSVVSAFY